MLECMTATPYLAIFCHVEALRCTQLCNEEVNDLLAGAEGGELQIHESQFRCL